MRLSTGPKPEYGNLSRLRVIFREGGSEKTHELTPDQVPVELPAILGAARRANPAARMIVKMDKDAPYGIMADMMTALQDAKAPRFNVMTELEGGAGALARAGQPAGH